MITAKGVLRDGLVELVFAQDGIDEVLRRYLAPGQQLDSLRFLRWHSSIDDWSEFPRRSHSNWLAPGERLLYRELSVSRMPRFQEWKAYATGKSSSKPTSLSKSGSALPRTSAGSGKSAAAPRVTPAGAAKTAAASRATLKRGSPGDPLPGATSRPSGDIS